MSSISAEVTIAEKKESLVKSFLWVENALSFMPHGLRTGQLISWHPDLTEQAGEKSQREGTQNLGHQFF